MMAVGPKISRDPGKPRPIALLEHLTQSKGVRQKTCDAGLIQSLGEHLKKALSDEEDTIAEKCIVSDEPSGGYILENFGSGPVPMIRISISRSIFLNETYFNSDYLRVDELRIRHLRETLWHAIERFFKKNL